MSYAGKIKEKQLAIKLRSQGLSYNEILKYISVSKDTLSRWCKDIQLTEEQKLRLITNKINGQKKGSLVAAENKRQARLNRINIIRKQSIMQIGSLSNRDKFITGIALYAAEGNKMDGKGGFANADPLLIKFMMDWLVEFAKIPLSRLRGAIWLHENLDEDNAKQYWSNLTGIPLQQFHKTYKSKIKGDSKKVRKNIHEYGIFTIRFSDSEIHRQIIGWIYALFNAKIV